MVHESLLRALKDNGLEEIESEGQAFDPNFHQALFKMIIQISNLVILLKNYKKVIS